MPRWQEPDPGVRLGPALFFYRNGRVHAFRFTAALDATTKSPSCIAYRDDVARVIPEDQLSYAERAIMCDACRYWVEATRPMELLYNQPTGG